MDKPEELDDLGALVARIRAWPKDWQSYAVEQLLEIEDELKNAIPIPPEDLADIQEGLDAEERGEFATEEEIIALFGRPFGQR